MTALTRSSSNARLLKGVMTALTRPFRRRFLAPAPREPAPADQDAPRARSGRRRTPVEIAPNDPLVAYLQSAGGAVDVDALELDSPALARAAGGRRHAGRAAGQPGRADRGAQPRAAPVRAGVLDRRPQLLDDLAAQAAPALRVAQLVREQEAEAATRERIEQELKVARLIQQNFLPKELPELPGWQVAAYYQPAREVGGDFYDFFALPDGRVGVVVGDVTDKGVPAALVMAATRSVLRAAAQRLDRPGEVLEQVNELLCPDMPEKMFVTCLYGVLDPATGRCASRTPATTCRTCGPPTASSSCARAACRSGCCPAWTTRRRRRCSRRATALLLYSDGVVEAHDPDREMFGFPRLEELVADAPGGQELIDRLLRELTASPAPTRAGGRHHARHARALGGVATRPSDDAPARRCWPSSRCRAQPGNERDGDRPGRARSRRRSPGAGPPRAAQDGASPKRR